MKAECLLSKRSESTKQSSLKTLCQVFLQAAHHIINWTKPLWSQEYKARNIKNNTIQSSQWSPFFLLIDESLTLNLPIFQSNPGSTSSLLVCTVSMSKGGLGNTEGPLFCTTSILNIILRHNQELLQCARLMFLRPVCIWKQRSGFILLFFRQIVEHFCKDCTHSNVHYSGTVETMEKGLTHTVIASLHEMVDCSFCTIAKASNSKVVNKGNCWATANPVISISWAAKCWDMFVLYIKTVFQTQACQPAHPNRQW